MNACWNKLSYAPVTWILHSIKINRKTFASLPWIIIIQLLPLRSIPEHILLLCSNCCGSHYIRVPLDGHSKTALALFVYSIFSQILKYKQYNCRFPLERVRTVETCPCKRDCVVNTNEDKAIIRFLWYGLMYWLDTKSIRVRSHIPNIC